MLSFFGCSVQVKRSQAQEEARRAACVWTDPLIVSISGQVLAVPATGRSSITLILGDPPLGDEPIDGPSKWPRRHSFCLDASRTQPIEATRIHISDDALLTLAEPFGFDTEHLLQIGVYSDGLGRHDWPAPNGDPARLTVLRTDNKGDRLHVAAGEFDPEGFRPGGQCNRTYDDRRACRLWIADAELGLIYNYMSLWIDDRDFDGAPVPEDFRDTARKLRALVAALEADAVEALTD